MQTHIRTVLETKGSEVQTTTPDTLVMDAVTQMNEHGIGALLVLGGGRLKGVFTERDVLRRVVAAAKDPKATKVADVMTSDVVVISPDVTVEEAMSVVTEKRCRHLPVLEGGRLVGLVSSGDLTRWVSRDQATDIQDLVEYINGPHVKDSVPPAS